MSYMIGYTGQTIEDITQWSHWTSLDQEYARRVKGLMDFCLLNGQPIGIGGADRTTAQQTSLFLSRHHLVASGGCCALNGRRYDKNPGMAHAAPPGQSYHEATSPAGKILAVDAVGNTVFAGQHCAEFGLVHFGNINGELWHWQPIELPHARSDYLPSMHPLGVFGQTPVTPAPNPAPPKPAIIVPAPTLQLGSVGKEVFQLQQIMQFWGWYPATSKCDGDYGPVTKWCVAVMQQVFKTTADGLYGPKTADCYLWFATTMQNLAK